MKRFVLDNMIINYLAEPPSPPIPDYSGAAELLRAKVRSREIEILGSIPLMEEITGTYKGCPEKFQKMWRLMGEVVRPRVLKPGNNRADEEVAKGRPLTESESLLDPHARAHFKRRAADEKWLEQKTDEVYAFKQSFQSTWQSACEDLEQALREHIKTEDSRTRVLREFFDNLPEHIQFFLQSKWGRRHGESSRAPEVRRLPSFYATYLFMYTKIVTFLEKGTKFKGGDGYDLLYFVDAWVADYLVTQDTGIIRTCDRIRQIEVLPFKILQSGDFIALLRE